MSLKDITAKVKVATVALGLFDESTARNPLDIVGSGFCIHPDGLIVSNKHVFEAFMNKPFSEHLAELPPEDGSNDIRPLRNLRGRRPYAFFFSTTLRADGLVALPVPAEAGMATIKEDLGMIRVARHAAFAGGFPALEVESYEEVWEGMDIGVCGFPLGSFLREQLGTVSSSFTRGHLSSIIPYQGVPLDFLRGFQLDVTATHGNSGGPVFSAATGRVVGVLTGGVVNPRGEIVPGIVRAEPVYPIAKPQFLEAMLKAQPGSIPQIEHL